MRRKRGVVTLAVLAVVVLAWYFWPKSFWEAAGVEKTDLHAASASYNAPGLTYRPGDSFSHIDNHIWVLESLDQDSGEFFYLLSRLERSRWRASLEGLLPRPASLEGGDGYITLSFSEIRDGPFILTLASSGKASFSLPNRKGPVIYTATDQALYADLSDFLKECGTPKPD